MCEKQVCVLNLNSDIRNVRFMACSEACVFSSLDHALQQDFKRHREIFGGVGKDNCLTGVWVGNLIALVSATLVSSSVASCASVHQ